MVITGKYHHHYFKKKFLPVITITEKMKTRLPVLPERKYFSTVNKPWLNYNLFEMICELTAVAQPGFAIAGEGGQKKVFNNI